jgi:hypothetical protein
MKLSGGHMEAERNFVERHEHFDPRSCGTICRIAAIACVILALCSAILLTTVDPSKCPGWTFPTSAGQEISIWAIFAITSLPLALVVSYHTVTWGRFAKRVLDQIHWGEETFVPGTEPTWYGDWTQFNALCARSLEFNSLFVCVMAAFVVCAAAPLVAMAINCF